MQLKFAFSPHQVLRDDPSTQWQTDDNPVTGELALGPETPPIIDDACMKTCIRDPHDAADGVAYLRLALQQGDVICSILPTVAWHWLKGVPPPDTYVASKGNTFVLRKRTDTRGTEHIPPELLLALRQQNKERWMHGYLSRLSVSAILASEAPEFQPEKLRQYLVTTAHVHAMGLLRAQEEKLLRQLQAGMAHAVFAKPKVAVK
jgi:hypothetical protein